jgi:hypothetical protein
MLRFIQWLVSLQWPLRLVVFLFGGFNPWLEENRRDPVPTYRRLRENTPIYRNRWQGTGASASRDRHRRAARGAARRP